MKQSGADGVMIGRSLIGAPWNLRDIIAGVDGLSEPAPLTNSEKGEIAIRHYRDLIDFYGEGRKFAAHLMSKTFWQFWRIYMASR